MFGYSLAYVTSAVWAAAAGMFGWTLLSIAVRRERLGGDWSPLERERREALMETSSTYRMLQPLIDELAKLNRLAFDQGQRDRMSDDLTSAGTGMRWRPEELLAVRQIEALVLGSIMLAIVLFRLPLLAGLLVGGMTAGMYLTTAMRSLPAQAQHRRKAIRSRLPYVIDLMALVVEAGGSFYDALQTTARETQGHPLGEELTRIQKEIAMGRPRRDVLRGFQDRVRDQDVADLVFAVNSGEDLGTPLAAVLRTQADQMRLRRSQYCEKAAAEAQVKLVYPGMVVMVGCMLIVLAPFLLPVILTPDLW